MPVPSDYPEEDWLALSGLQHYAFCKRQWALIHVEQQCQDNYLTTAGSLEHDRAHDYAESEARGDLLIMRDLRVLRNVAKERMKYGQRVQNSVFECSVAPSDYLMHETCITGNYE